MVIKVFILDSKQRIKFRIVSYFIFQLKMYEYIEEICRNKSAKTIWYISITKSQLLSVCLSVCSSVCLFVRC